LLQQVISKYIPFESPVRQIISDAVKLLPDFGNVSIPTEMDVDNLLALASVKDIPEVEVYISTLVLTTLLRHSLFDAAAQISAVLIDRVKVRSLFPPHLIL